MSKIQNIAVCLIGVSSILGCVEEVTLPNEDFVPIPIVEASLRGQKVSGVMRYEANAIIYRSSPIDKVALGQTYIEDAEVRVVEYDENDSRTDRSIELERKRVGVFGQQKNWEIRYEADQIELLDNHRYQLEVTIPPLKEGETRKKYVSSKEKVPTLVPIQRVETTLGESSIKVSFQDVKDENNYYLWLTKKTSGSDKRRDEGGRIFFIDDRFFDGTQTSVILNRIFTNDIERNDTLDISQLSIGNVAYRYLNGRLNQHIATESSNQDPDPLAQLFSTAPATIPGNIYSVDGESTPGVFLIGSGSHQRKIAK